MGGKTKESNEASKNKENLTRYHKIYSEVQEILEDNHDEEYDDLKLELEELLDEDIINLKDPDDINETWEEWEEFGEEYQK